MNSNIENVIISEIKKLPIYKQAEDQYLKIKISVPRITSWDRITNSVIP